MPVSRSKQQREDDTRQSKSEDSAREQGREPTSEEREPPVFENGLNTGANIQEALDVEELDYDLYRSKVSIVRIRMEPQRCKSRQ